MNHWEKRILPRDFYDREPLVVAEELLGKLLVRKVNGVFLVGMITETEAYLPSGDPAAHAFKGPTQRNASLYKHGGHAYVHRMHRYCLLDIVTEGPEKPGSVLIRALEPVEGIQGLVNGPGKICREMHISHELDGVDVTNPTCDLFVMESGVSHTPHTVIRSPRVGISQAKEALLRFRTDPKHTAHIASISRDMVKQISG